MRGGDCALCVLAYGTYYRYCTVRYSTPILKNLLLPAGGWWRVCDQYLSSRLTRLIASQGSKEHSFVYSNKAHPNHPPHATKWSGQWPLFTAFVETNNVVLLRSQTQIPRTAVPFVHYLFLAPTDALCHLKRPAERYL